MNRKSIWHEIELAIRADKRNNPSWPDHAAGQAGKVIVPSSTLMTKSMDYKYGASDVSDEVMIQQMKDAAVQTAAMAIRFLENIKTVKDAKNNSNRDEDKN